MNFGESSLIWEGRLLSLLNELCDSFGQLPCEFSVGNTVFVREVVVE